MGSVTHHPCTKEIWSSVWQTNPSCYDLHLTRKVSSANGAVMLFVQFGDKTHQRWTFVEKRQSLCFSHSVFLSLFHYFYEKKEKREKRKKKHRTLGFRKKDRMSPTCSIYTSFGYACFRVTGSWYASLQREENVGNNHPLFPLRAMHSAGKVLLKKAYHSSKYLPVWIFFVSG